MSSRLITETIPAGGQIVLPEIANFLMLIETAGPVTVQFTRDGGNTSASGVQAGYVKGLVRPWDRASVQGTAGSSISFFIGFEEISQDFTDYRRTVGVFEQQLSSVLGAAPADVDVGGVAGPVQLVAANASRRKVTVGVGYGALTYVRVSNAAVAANRGAQIGPGQSYTYEGDGPVFAIREAVAAAMMWVQEELY